MARAKLICVAFLLTLRFCGPAPAIAQDKPELPKLTSSQAEELVTEQMQQQGIPGLSVAIAVGNQLVYAEGFGFADLEHETPTLPATRFRTASIAKPMTAVVVLGLAESKQLDLDAAVQESCPEYPEKKWKVTSRQLLGHLGGVRHYKTRAETVATTHFFNLKSALEVFADDPLQHEPGTKFLYSTFGYNLLGSVAEGAADKSFLELLRTRVFEPAGMTDTVADDHYTIIPRRARGYIRMRPQDMLRFPDGVGLRVGKLYNAPLHDTSMKIPGGGLLSTAPDLVRFAVAVNQHQLLTEQTVKQMWETQRTADGKETGYGLGWSVSESEGRLVVGHGGGQAGTSTYLVLKPETGTAVAVMCNLQNASLKELCAKIIELVEPDEQSR